MRSFFLGLFLLVGLFMFSGGVDAEWSTTLKCCKPGSSTDCSQDHLINGATKAACETSVNNKKEALVILGFTQCQGGVCSESKENECTTKGGQCIPASNQCPDGKDEILADGCSDIEKCCPKSTATNACTAGGGVCVSGKKCPNDKDPLGPSCPDAGTPQTCCPKPGGGGPGGTGGAVIEFQNPLKYDTVQEVVGALLAALQGIIVLLSIVFIVIGAVMYVTSAGNEGMVKLAKGAILASMIGLAIGIAAPTFLKEIYDILDASPEVTIPEEVESATPLRDILTNTLNFLLAIIGVLSMIMLVVGGIMYLLSGGDEKRIDTGKKIVVFSLIGLTVALASLILVRQIANFFG